MAMARGAGWALLAAAMALGSDGRAIEVADELSWPRKVAVQTDRGEILGKVDGDVVVFHSVPFAAPPVGKLRFRPPQDVDPWDGRLDATRVKDVCPQLSLKEGSFLHLGGEDCLYMHVYMPRHAPETPGGLPVLFWIYGGAFDVGDGWELGLYDGHGLADAYNVVVVAPNYRVGAFGFLALDALREEDEHGSLGNMGIQDQRAALEFVQRNAPAFGGDPKRVTIFGESAGAMSVCHHLSNGAHPDLFWAAIMESGTCDAPEFFLKAGEAVALGELLAETMGCDAGDLACLRGLPTRDVLFGALTSLGVRNATFTHPGLPTLTPAAPFGPVIDGTDAGLPRKPLDAFRAGRHNRVPLIIGTDENEGSLFVPLMRAIVPGLPLKLDEVSVARIAHHVFDPILGQNGKPADVQPVLSIYPASEFRNQDERLATLIRDYFFVCPSRRAARSLSAQGMPVYAYQFVYAEHWLENRLLHDYHSSEISFVFGNKAPFFWHRWTREDNQMRDIMQSFWTTFAKTRSPNAQAMPGPKRGALAALRSSPVEWPRFDSALEAGGAHLVLDTTLAASSGLLKEKCDFFDDYLDLH